jgi:mannose-6-phosphate isomerase-like protein (cupin superfamily)
MAKIMCGNWNDLPWRGMETKKVGDEYKVHSVVFCMEAENLMCLLGECLNGMPETPHNHPHEQIALVIQGECDYVVDGIPYRLTPGGWVNVPPHYEHYSRVYRTKEPCLQMDLFSPGRPSSIEPYKKWMKEEYGIDWDAGVREVPDLTAPKNPNLEVRS